MTRSALFFNVQPVAAALETVFDHWTPQRSAVIIDARQALDKVLTKDVTSPKDLPEFTRSTVDGYAVRAADTFGATASLPTYLTVTGRVAMGQTAKGNVQSGQAVEIHTGGMLPDGADAVVMLEQTQTFGNNELEVLSPVAPGENLVQIGEDVTKGTVILEAGHRIRPQDIGGLLAVGVLEVEVTITPRVGILSCGDELVPPESTPSIGQIRDINAYTLAALVEAAGGQPILLGIARDDLDDFTAKARDGFEQVDMLIITAGSSVSVRDLTSTVISTLGSPGILQHGLAVKPGKPTILAVCANKPVIGLPGNPVSALQVARQVVVPLIEHFRGARKEHARVIQAILSQNIASTTGREDSIPVKLVERDGMLYADPVFGKSNLIFTLIDADGYVVVQLDSNGLRAGSDVNVHLF